MTTSVNLRERLRALRPAAGNRTIGVAPSSTAMSGSNATFVRHHAADHHFDDRHPVDFGDDITVHSFPTPGGPALGAEKLYPLDYKQGRIALDTALSVPDVGWRRLLPMADFRFPIERAVFLDVETTGLSRGTGTYAFLIGVGRFVDGQFRLRQFFMRDYGDEHTHLEALHAELADAEAVVTFNGRSFDWPLLETRATMNRLRLPRLPHLDLLHSARRVWRPIIGGCSLTELEQAVLQLERRDDVPGHLIPQRYFDFLQTGDATPLVDVLVHNRLDIVSMVALVGHIGRAVAAPREWAVGGQALSGAELFTIGRWLLPHSEGIACLEEALYRGLPMELRRQCGRLLATSYKRNERVDEAVAMFESLTTEDGLSTWAYIELAKHYEHRARDLRTARQWTMRALDLMQRRRLLRAAGGGAGRGADRGADRSAFEEDLEVVLHRLRRIERKLGTSSK